MPVLLVKVAPSASGFRPLIIEFTLTGDCSNLTFGAGGKDSSGVIRAGWGYYEVGDSSVL